MIDLPEQLKLAKERLRSEPAGHPVSVRSILSWFGWKRRGNIQVRHLVRVLKQEGLETVPDFREVYLDNEVTLRRVNKYGSQVPPPATDLHSEEGLDEDGPTVGTLQSSGSGVIAVSKHDPLTKAMALMLTHDYSQLPVMQGDRKVEGLISWESIGGSIARGESCVTVGECMDTAITTLKFSDSLFDYIPTIIEEEVVLVRGSDDRITGLVTTTDLSTKFQELSGAFLFLGKIEILIRRLINNRFTKAEIQLAKDPRDTERTIESITDMSFGEYVRLLDHDTRWDKLGLKLDRKTVIDKLKAVNLIRNEVMHFSPDGPADDDLALLAKTESFLTQIVK